MDCPAPNGLGQFFEGDDLFGVEFLSHEGNRIPEWGKSARGGIQPIGQERLSGRGKQGRRFGPSFPDS